MASVRNKIEAWGKDNGVGPSLKRIIKKLKNTYSERVLSEMFGCTVSAVRYWFKECEILRTRPTFKERLSELGYPSLHAFFTDPRNIQGRRTLRQLARETGFCYPTVLKWYKVFLKELTKKGS